ncbi:hypothetical protein K443DRAFT_102455 [Laccaria amethystina LaAM-08-1]|uniref:Hydrophobic surface binding protein A n=1 Tax=Laccaria amethystina LaAM-08-1 TaxID=1095629 RepID=A0A0C9X2L1_9AGAR|nr:hypothetical protein K443DRAFT_102455 [Laccaria amethystina LaAM-08-1]
MRFTAIFFLTASLVNVAFSYTAKELDTIQQHLTQLKSDLDTINADLSKISGADGTFSQVISFPVGDDESQALVISTVASYYPDAENAVNGFIDGKPTFERLGVTSLVKSALTRFISALNASAEALVAHSSPELSAKATAVAEQYKALGEKALADFS